MKSYCCKGTVEGIEFCAPTNHLQPTAPTPPPPTRTHHYSCTIKLSPFTTKIITIKDFTGGAVLEKKKKKYQESLLLEAPQT